MNNFLTSWQLLGTLTDFERDKVFYSFPEGRRICDKNHVLSWCTELGAGSQHFPYCDKLFIKTKQTIGLTTTPIDAKIPLYSLLLGGQSCGLQVNLHFLWRWQASERADARK